MIAVCVAGGFSQAWGVGIRGRGQPHDRSVVSALFATVAVVGTQYAIIEARKPPVQTPERRAWITYLHTVPQVMPSFLGHGRLGASYLAF